MYSRIEIITETEMLVYNYTSEYDADNGLPCVFIDTHPLPKSIEEWAADNGFQLGGRGYFKTSESTATSVGGNGFFRGNVAEVGL